MADKFVLGIAAKLAARSLDAYNAYLAEADRDLAEGHRPHYCEHGMNLWVDWDPICGACEDGVTAADGVHRRTVALREAHRRVEQFNRIVSVMSDRAMADLLDGSAVASRLKELVTVA